MRPAAPSARPRLKIASCLEKPYGLGKDLIQVATSHTKGGWALGRMSSSAAGSVPGFQLPEPVFVVKNPGARAAACQVVGAYDTFQILGYMLRHAKSLGRTTRFTSWSTCCGMPSR